MLWFHEGIIVPVFEVNETSTSYCINIIRFPMFGHWLGLTGKGVWKPFCSIFICIEWGTVGCVWCLCLRYECTHVSTRMRTFTV